MAHIALAASARRWHKVVQPVSKAGRLCKDAATKDNKPRSRGLAYHRSALPLPAATVFRRGDPVARPMPPLPERLLVCPAPPKRVAGQRPGPPAPPAWPVDCGNQCQAPSDREGVQRPARAARPAPDGQRRHKRRGEAAHRPAHQAPRRWLPIVSTLAKLRQRLKWRSKLSQRTFPGDSHLEPAHRAPPAPLPRTALPKARAIDATVSGRSQMRRLPGRGFGSVATPCTPREAVGSQRR